MSTTSITAGAVPATHPVSVQVGAALDNRNRLTCGFRFILAFPHLLLVGGPMAFAFTWFGSEGEPGLHWGGAGALGAVAGAIAVIAWFAIVFGSRFPAGLWRLSSYYLHWRVRAIAYLVLLRDEYPPFGEGAYPARLTLPAPGTRDRVSVAFRLILAIPHLIALWVLGFAWAVATIVAWFAILFTGRHPRALFDFSAGMLRWSTRVEAYLLLLRDEYPPFSLD